jgi:hypothetical protein
LFVLVAVKNGVIPMLNKYKKYRWAINLGYGSSEA